MEKPEKVKPEKEIGQPNWDYCEGYNKSCNEWEEFLPKKDELITIISSIIPLCSFDDRDKLAETISERITGGRDEEIQKETNSN